MRFLVAPDKFKHALPAPDVAAEIAVGLRSAHPDLELDLCPLADGGEGTAAALGGVVCRAVVCDAVGRQIEAEWRAAPGGIATLDLAAAAGLAQLSEELRDPMHTSTYGAGLLLNAALVSAPTRLRIALGGSATVDGGAGFLQALGWKLHDERGQVLAKHATGEDLGRISRLEPPEHDVPLPPIDLLCDVENPLLGERGAARVFGPQKGASPDHVRALEYGLARWADRLRECHGVNVSNLRRGGAAGGAAAGLHAALGAKLVGGFETVAEALSLTTRIAAADLIISGEGRLDESSLEGKVVGGMAQLAGAANKPLLLIVGACELPCARLRGRGAPIRVLPLRSQPSPADAAALRATPADLRSVAAGWARAGFAMDSPCDCC